MPLFPGAGTAAGTLAAGDDSRFASVPAIPADRGFLAWSYPPFAVAGSTALPVAGTLYLTRIRRTPPGPITNIHVCMAGVGVTLTTGQCFASLFTAAGAKIDASVDQAANWVGAIGLKTMALAGGAYTHTGGDLYAGVWFNGTTGPTLMRLGQLAGMTNVGLATPNLQSATANTGLTTTQPGNLTSQASVAFEYWMALS